MNKKKRRMPKIMWLSPHKLVFESPFKMDFSVEDLRELGLCGKKKVLIVAEQGKDLRFLEGNDSMPDMLCWFCQYGFSPFLLSYGHVCNCLLAKHHGWTKFCKDFMPGPTFGQDKRRDMGERRRRAEEILSKTIWEHCIYCDHWNTKNVVKTYSEGGATFIESDSKNAFCEIREKPHHWKTPCRKFRLTKDPQKRVPFERQKSKLQEYIRELKKNEKLEQRSTIVC